MQICYSLTIFLNNNRSDILSKHRKNYNYNRKRNKKKSFEDMMDDYLKESQHSQKTLKKRYNRQANIRKVRNKNKGKGDESGRD